MMRRNPFLFILVNLVRLGLKYGWNLGVLEPPYCWKNIHLYVLHEFESLSSLLKEISHSEMCYWDHLKRNTEENVEQESKKRNFPCLNVGMPLCGGQDCFSLLWIQFDFPKSHLTPLSRNTMPVMCSSVVLISIDMFMQIFLSYKCKLLSFFKCWCSTELTAVCKTQIMGGKDVSLIFNIGSFLKCVFNSSTSLNRPSLKFQNFPWTGYI